jgi:hypothetical protein
MLLPPPQGRDGRAVAVPELHQLVHADAAPSAAAALSGRAFS